MKLLTNGSRAHPTGDDILDGLNSSAGALNPRGDAPSSVDDLSYFASGVDC